MRGDTTEQVYLGYSLGMVICSSKRFVLNSFGLSAQDLKLCYLIRARLCNKAIAVITPKSVLKTKQRIKNKIGLSGKDNLDRLYLCRKKWLCLNGKSRNQFLLISNARK